MGRIQTNIGLITGIPITDTVDQLMALSGRPRDMLSERTQTLKSEQVAVTELSALLLTVRYMTDNLGKESLYDQRAVTSSSDSVMSAVVTGDPPKGTHQFTPIRTAQNQQLLTSGFKSGDEPIGGGKLSFRFGDHVQSGIELDRLSGGDGIRRGMLRVTDRSGASAQIDLSTVQTIDDVLDAINGNTVINVTAVANGDRLRLVDNTGQDVSNLKVQEIGSGTTAASLGLAGIDTSENLADGQDLLWLTEDVDLDFLNDRSGVNVNRVLGDVEYELRDGTTGTIDFSPIIVGGSDVAAETSLGEIIDIINAAKPGKLSVEIAADGDRLVIRDLTEGDGQFNLQAANESEALVGLGLDGESVDGVITGRRLVAGLKTVLLSSLGGGDGLGKLGLLELTDRSGATNTIDLSSAETLDDVIDQINSAGVGIVAAVNSARNGIQLVDTTGVSASNLIVTGADETNTAEKLQIAVDAEVTSVNSGDMHLQVVAHNTRLSDLNGGAGVARGVFSILDSAGRQAYVNLNKEEIQTVGDVIREINRLGVDVRAEINQSGDGIRIVDRAGGNGKLRINNYGSTTATDLHLDRQAVETEIDGETSWVLDGTSTFTVQLEVDVSINDLRDKINALDAGVQATAFFDGSNKPYRLSLLSTQAGKAGELLFDTSQIDLGLQETNQARDALLVLGEASAAGSNVLISSTSNEFTGVLSGVTLEVKQPSSVPVTLTVDTSDTNVVASVTAMVVNYNRFRERLLELTAYDVESNTSSLLTGDGAAVRLDSQVSYLLSGRFTGAGPIQSLGELGITFINDGTLQFDSSKLKTRFAEDPESVKQFFTQEDFGFSAKFDELTEQLAGQDVSLLAQRFITLRGQIQQNEDRITFLNGRLDVQREALLMQFYRMEIAIGKLQNNAIALDSFQALDPWTGNPAR